MSRRLAISVSLLGAALCSTAAISDEWTLSSGETIRGSLVEQTEDLLVIDHAILGRLSVARGDLATTSDSASGSNLDATLEIQTDVSPAEWQSKFDFGFSVSTGNTDTQDLNFGITSKRKDAETRTKLDARYFWGATGGDRNTNKATAGVINDWFVPDSKWLYFADARFDYDEFNSWETRVSGHVGAGYHLIDEEDFDLTLRAGIGGFHEFNSPREEFIPEALFGGELDWQIDDRQTFSMNATIYPDLDDSGEFRAVSGANWSYALSDDSNLKLNVGLYDEYQSKVGMGVEHNDLKIYGGLSFDF